MLKTSRIVVKGFPLSFVTSRMFSLYTLVIKKVIPLMPYNYLLAGGATFLITSVLYRKVKNQSLGSECRKNDKIDHKTLFYIHPFTSFI